MILNNKDNNECKKCLHYNYFLGCMLSHPNKECKKCPYYHYLFGCKLYPYKLHLCKKRNTIIKNDLKIPERSDSI